MPKKHVKKLKKRTRRRSMRLPKHMFHSVNEEHVYKAENGKVLVNDWLRKTVDDNKMKIQGNVNHKKINMTRRIRPMPRYMLFNL